MQGTFDLSWLVAFLSLVTLELVLGIDNVIFVSILCGRLPQENQARARRLGMGLAMGMRIALLCAISWVIQLTQPLFTLGSLHVSGRDLILVGGGLFLLAKSTHEIHQKLEGEEHAGKPLRRPTFRSVLIQVILLDIVFSLDSVITAIGMVDRLDIMVAAIIVAVACMMAAAGSISAFVERHPTVKILALSFLLLIGVSLIAEGFHHHIPKGYIYFSMAFSIFVEMINLRLRKTQTKPVRLHGQP